MTERAHPTEPRIALVSYSTRPRGGVVHTLSLAEAMVEAGMNVTVLALGDPGQGFHRPVRGAPVTVLPAPQPLPTLEQRVFASIDALERGLFELADDFDILHAQDCISARAAARVRDSGAGLRVVRTVHHVDDFTTRALIDCQRQAILEPDQLVVVSEEWRHRLRVEFGRDAEVIHNGVDPARFPPIPAARREALRRELGLSDRFVFLAVGGIEPRKGTVFTFQAMAELARTVDPRPALVVVGGHSFQDYTRYREEALAMLPELGLTLGEDVFLVGTVSDRGLHEWYRSADALVFPSLKEGWGLVVLEAMAAELPVVTSDIPVLLEYLTDRETALMTRAQDAGSLADGMRELAGDDELRTRLVMSGRQVPNRFRWDRAAQQHRVMYATALKRESG